MGSDYETYLTVSADGSVVVHENGSGALTRFTPEGAVDPGAAADKIIDAMRKKTTVSDKVAANLKKKLMGDAEIRRGYAKKFDVKAKLAAGTVLYSNTRGLQQVHKTKNGFKKSLLLTVNQSFSMVAVSLPRLKIRMVTAFHFNMKRVEF